MLTPVNPVLVHPWDMDWCDANYWLPWLVGMPAETSLAICSVLMGGIMSRCGPSSLLRVTYSTYS